MSDATNPPASDASSGDQAGAPTPPPPYGRAGAAWPYSQPAPAARPPQPPYGGPGPGPYPGPYIPPVPTQGNTGRIIAIVIGVVLLLTCGGCFALGALVVETGRDMVNEIEDYEPETIAQTAVEPGAAFEVGDLSFADGWQVVVDGPVVRIDGLVASTTSTNTLGVAITMTFFKADRELGTATCAGGAADPGEAVTLKCLVTDKQVRRADRVVVESLL